MLKREVPKILHSCEKSLANNVPLNGNWKWTVTFKLFESQEAFVPTILFTTIGSRCFAVDGKASASCSSNVGIKSKSQRYVISNVLPLKRLQNLLVYAKKNNK